MINTDEIPTGKAAAMKTSMTFKQLEQKYFSAIKIKKAVLVISNVLTYGILRYIYANHSFN